MTLKDIYQRFLELPNPISLSENASLHYITTLTTLTQPVNIVRHLETQNKKLVKTKSARIISAVEGPNAVALEVETVLEFISGGGSYLPGLENFVVDKIATIPVTHIVHFDAQQKISVIRISWDQASLLKQTEVIGSRGKNWPVVDGKDQVRLINSSLTAALSASELPTTPRGRSENQSLASSRNVSPSKRHIKDPHASLDLFSPKPVDENEPTLGPNAVAPRASARPPPREMSELFAAGHEDHEPGSPKKVPIEPVVAPKKGSNQKFGPPRLFADDPNEPAPVGYKSNPAKYNHFNLGEELEDDPLQYRDATPKPKTTMQAVPVRGKSNRQQSQWDFADFFTPEKVTQKVRDQDIVHFSLDSTVNDVETPGKKIAGKPRRDNEIHFELQDDGTPIERHAVPKPRKDAETHFQLRDTATPATNRTSDRPTSSASDRMGLYSNNVFDEDENGKAQEKPPLSTITNNTNRKHDFDSHWTMADASPANGKANNENKPASKHRKKPSQMDTHWDPYEETTDQPQNPPAQSRLRKGMESHWSMGDEEEKAGTNGKSKTQKSFWDF
ncbi:hypothetical protein AYO21_05138 [Fonsecaea monophora]|uniref:Uncharacterized protein n=1 Tax=Fonsecaea monophora TaxID=254056 RepID=A0A177FB36_9EURO|nr:hypothetical protein AYO21_05138 [Fonsecaea monophora]KAH0832453.1 hypothetical protein FOPE_01138 [Fonsecaea pedrosoi]OAG40642.1 hypothetical protein AYO21_05138 [Fonsecaea monophora]